MIICINEIIFRFELMLKIDDNILFIIKSIE